MQVPSDVSIWLGQMAEPLTLIVALLAFLLLVLYLSARVRSIKMNAARSGVTEDTFVASLLPYGFDPNIARTTYRYLRQVQRVGFPIDASDLLDEDLGLDSEAVDRSVIDILALTGRVHRPGLQHAPIATVEELVRLIQASPRLSQLAA